MCNVPKGKAVDAPFFIESEHHMISTDNAILRVKRIRQSRNGPFSVADLITEFGEFKVKDPILEQFEEGEYEATVWISEIYLGTYVLYGKAVTEIRARLHDVQVHSEDHRPAEEELLEPDPIDEDEPIRLPKQPEQAQAAEQPEQPASVDRRWDEFKKPRKSRSEAKAAGATAPEQADSLFDEEAQAALERREAIALDRSVDRALLRQQIQALKDRGYRFDALSKLWVID